MKSKISFSGDPYIINLIAAAAKEIYEQNSEESAEAPQEPPVVIMGKGQQPGVSFASAPQFEIGPDGLIIVPPKKQREKAEYKAHREAAEKARAEQEKQLSPPSQPAVMPHLQPAELQQAPTEPNAFANYAIQQQHQFAQQPVHNGPQNTAPSFPQQPTGFPATAPAQAATGFPASNPAQAPVATNGQPWLNPATINQQGPTFNDLNSLIQPIIADSQKRQTLGNWLAHKGIQDLTQIADQPAVLAEAYQVATQILNGQIQ